MLILSNVSAMLYFMAAVNYYSLTKAILSLTKTEHSDSYVRWQAVVWPYYVGELMLYLVIDRNDEEDEDE